MFHIKRHYLISIPKPKKKCIFWDCQMLQFMTCTFWMGLLNNYILITDRNNLILYFTLSEAISELLVLLLQYPFIAITNVSYFIAIPFYCNH